jgi:hypothetical protein
MRFQLKTADGNSVEACANCVAMFTAERAPAPGDTYAMVDGTVFVVDAIPTEHRFRIGPGGLELRVDVQVRAAEKPKAK